MSGLDALRLAGITGTARLAVPVLVLTRDVDRRALGPVRLRRTDRPYPATLIDWQDGPSPVMVASPARALSDLAGLGAAKATVRALVTEAAQRGLVTPDQLLDESSSMRRNGSAGFRTAIEDVLDGAASIAEARAVDHLRGADVPPFELNVPVLHRGVIVAVVDILWRELLAVVEVDSRRHHAYGADWERTLQRHNRLTALGLAVRHDPPRTLGTGWARDVAGWLRRRALEVGRAVPVRCPGAARAARRLPAAGAGLIAWRSAAQFPRITS